MFKCICLEWNNPIHNSVCPLLYITGLKAHTHMPIFRGSAVESVDSALETADSTTDSVIVGRLAILNMFNILGLLELANRNRSTIAVGRWQISLVGMGLYGDIKSSFCIIT